LLLRGRCPSRAPRIREWEQEHLQNLTPEQREALSKIEKLHQETWGHSLNIEEHLEWMQDHHEAMTAHQKELAKAVRKAKRLGQSLCDHPFVREWVQTHRNLGNRRALHPGWRVDPGLEKGVKKPLRLTPAEASLMAEVVRLLERHTISATFMTLQNQNRLPVTTQTGRTILNSRRAFDRWVRRHFLLDH
jgi:hypothetical protein